MGIWCCFIWLQYFILSEYLLSTSEQLKLDLEVQFSLTAITLGWALYFKYGQFGHIWPYTSNMALYFKWIANIFRFSVSLMKLWSVQNDYDIRKEFIQNLDSFWITLYKFITLSNRYFSIEIIFFDNNGLTTFQNFLL